MKQQKTFAPTARQLSILSLILFVCIVSVRAQTPTFTYQGRLSDSTAAANGSYDLGFALYDAATGGNQIGAALTRANVTVANGIFTVQLNFGANAFPGVARYLEIAVKRPTDTNFTTLTPRQQVTSTPYAIRAASSATADAATTATTAINAQQLGGTAASQFVQTNDARLTDARTPTAGSANYIQNTTTQQTSSNFNISGTGEANIFNARTQFNIGGNRVLGVPAADTVTIGINAGTALNANNINNTFVGAGAGAQCESNSDNGSTSTCLSNAFFGKNAGASLLAGGNNTFIGNETNNFNPLTNGGGAIRGNFNTMVGARASLTSDDLNYATVIGADAYATQSNSIVLGRASGSDKIFAYGPMTTFGAFSLNDKQIRLRDSLDAYHTISYNSTINGILFTAFDDFSWFNHRNTRVNMRLSSDGNLAIVGSYNKFSDARYKTNVQTIANPLDSIRRLRGVTFNWIPEFNNSANQIGFIAQEVEQVLPELVHTDKEGFKSVAYSDAVPVLVEAVKEQQTQIEAKQNQLDALREQIKQQQSVIDGLKKLVCAGNPNADVCRQP